MNSLTQFWNRLAEERAARIRLTRPRLLNGAPSLRVTHTFVTLEVSAAAYEEIRAKLAAADYDHCFMEGGEIDMHGIALVREVTDLLSRWNSRLTSTGDIQACRRVRNMRSFMSRGSYKSMRGWSPT